LYVGEEITEICEEESSQEDLVTKLKIEKQESKLKEVPINMTVMRQKRQDTFKNLFQLNPDQAKKLDLLVNKGEYS